MMWSWLHIRLCLSMRCSIDPWTAIMGVGWVFDHGAGQRWGVFRGMEAGAPKVGIHESKAKALGLVEVVAEAQAAETEDHDPQGELWKGIGGGGRRLLLDPSLHHPSQTQFRPGAKQIKHLVHLLSRNGPVGGGYYLWGVCPPPPPARSPVSMHPAL